MTTKPVIALTMGDVAGIGPELIARLIVDPEFLDRCIPCVVGDPMVLARALELVGQRCSVPSVESPTECASYGWGCWNPGGEAIIGEVAAGQVLAIAGRAAYRWTIHAALAAMKQEVHAIVTAPLCKEALHAAGVSYPGHTEILASVCGTTRVAMMLYLPPSQTISTPLAVAHVTLHTALRNIFSQLSIPRIVTTARLLTVFLRRIGLEPRLGLCALNPHAGENGLFGDEEKVILVPALEELQHKRVPITGPWPADTLFRRATAGEFNGVVALYHDQGHIALKLLGWNRAVNITLGLPIIRTSPSHGTAYDIAWKGMASVEGMRAACEVALQLLDSPPLDSAGDDLFWPDQALL
ncbi:MAG: 4-hydroxythreonine-4-phosphate dehydrogenase [Planctomycetaceae bacterium]|nr:MAG: 4-hydroxythreonine-4-phosphate dehydrogenase [Planctomycetaceae bacterium]